MYYKCIDKNHTLRKDTAEVATERAGLRVPNGYKWIPLEGMAKEKRKKNDLKKVLNLNVQIPVTTEHENIHNSLLVISILYSVILINLKNIIIIIIFGRL